MNIIRDNEMNDNGMQPYAVSGSVCLNEFAKNVFKALYNLLNKIEDDFPAQFSDIQISTRNGGKSFYIKFDDKQDSNFDYSIRISDHQLNSWNSLSYNCIGNIISNDGNVTIKYDMILKNLKKVRLGYCLITKKCQDNIII